MYINLFVISKTKKEAEKIFEKTIQSIRALITKKEIIKIEPYWKIKEQYKIEASILLEKDFTQDNRHDFLLNIADKWETWGEPTEEALSSVTMNNCNFNIGGIYMIHILF